MRYHEQLQSRINKNRLVLVIEKKGNLGANSAIK